MTPPRTHSSPVLILLAVLALQILLFSFLGTRFATLENALEIIRVSVEIGLLALALTPVIITGGIDLSVGALMGLSAVLFGKLWRDVGLDIPWAILGTLLAGLLAGGLNGWLITRFRLPPLIVTLGTMSLFRGLAEGLTGGVDNFTGFPPALEFLGQGYWFGWIPAQLPLFLLVAAAFWLLQHRTIHGRAFVAIGFSPEGARYAGIPIERRLLFVYSLCGLVASVAAIIYVAHLGQAKADAGTNYELLAITAVVLGGTSIFGGRGTIPGTLLGLLVIAVLQNGLRLAALPTELAGLLTGLLLLATMSLEQWSKRSPLKPPAMTEEEFTMKNGQVAVICLVILAAAGIVAGSNWFLVQNLKNNPGLLSSHTPPTPAKPRLTVAMMPKSKGNAYFIACRKGAEDAARELDLDLIWDGPSDPDPAKQNEVVDTWITRGVDVIAVAVENRDGISSVLRKARQRGIKVITWDADAATDARDFFVNQATPEGIGNTLMDEAARILGGSGEFAIITASLTAANMIEWQKHIEARRATLYPNLKMAVLRPCDDLQQKAFEETRNILSAYPNVKLIMAICSPAVPGAAEAVKQAGRKDVKVIGLSLPNDNKKYVHEGITESVILWNTADLGYLTVHAARQVHSGELKPASTQMKAGRLGTVKLRGDHILLGEPFIFNKGNIDRFDF